MFQTLRQFHRIHKSVIESAARRRETTTVTDDDDFELDTIVDESLHIAAGSCQRPSSSRVWDRESEFNSNDATIFYPPNPFYLVRPVPTCLISAGIPAVGHIVPLLYSIMKYK